MFGLITIPFFKQTKVIWYGFNEEDAMEQLELWVIRTVKNHFVGHFTKGLKQPPDSLFKMSRCCILLKSQCSHFEKLPQLSEHACGPAPEAN